MDKLERVVKCVFDTDRHGSRVLRRDAHTLILMDHASFPQRLLDVIAEQHPNVHISVHATEASQSGYIVIFTACPSKNVLFSAHAVQYASLIVLMSMLISCMHSTFA